MLILADDTKREILHKSPDTIAKSPENNNLYCSTPLRTANGNMSDISLDADNGNYSTTQLDQDDITPIKASAKEKLMNSINTNTNSSFPINLTSTGVNTNGLSNKTDGSNSSLNIDNSVTTSEKISNKFNGTFNNINSSFNPNSNSFNNVNLNTGWNNTTTIIADIEGEVKKKSRYVDKTYYIAKEILMTELTYKKDLDVIHVVSMLFMLLVQIIALTQYCFSKF